MAANEQSGVDALGAETVFAELVEGRRIHIGKSVRDRAGWASAKTPVAIIIQILPARRARIRPAEAVEAWIEKIVGAEGEEIRKELALILFSGTIQTNGNIFLPTPVVRALTPPGEILDELVVRSARDQIDLMMVEAFEAAAAELQRRIAAYEG